MSGVEIALGSGCNDEKDNAQRVYRIIDPSSEILSYLDLLSVEERTEICARICYKSEEDMTVDSAIDLCRKMITHKHNSVVEMAVLSFHVIAMGGMCVNYAKSQNT